MARNRKTEQHRQIRCSGVFRLFRSVPVFLVLVHAHKDCLQTRKVKVDVVFFLETLAQRKFVRLVQNVADKTLFKCLYHVVECFTPWFFLLIARYSISHSKFKCSESGETFGHRSKILGGILLKDYFASPWDTPVSGTGTRRITRTRTRLHGKPIKLKIHRVTPGTICANIQGLYRVSYAIWTSSKICRKIFLYQI